MRVKITREAVSGSDDQCGPPMEMFVEMGRENTIEDLVGKIVESKFLQFSSTYMWSTGYAGKIQIVKIFAQRDEHSNSCSKDADYFIPKSSIVSEVFKADTLSFRLSR